MILIIERSSIDILTNIKNNMKNLIKVFTLILFIFLLVFNILIYNLEIDDILYNNFIYIQDINEYNKDYKHENVISFFYFKKFTNLVRESVHNSKGPSFSDKFKRKIYWTFFEPRKDHYVNYEEYKSYLNSKINLSKEFKSWISLQKKTIQWILDRRNNK